MDMQAPGQGPPPRGLFARLFGRTRAPHQMAVPVAAAADMPAEPARLVGDASVAWFRLATCQNKVVSLAEGDSRLGFTDALDAAHAILAAVPAGMPHVCVLFAPDGRAFHIAADTQSGIAASALILQTDTRGVVRLKYPLGNPAFLIAMHADAGTTPGGADAGIRFDGAGNTMDVAFSMIAVAATDVPAAARAIGAEIGLAAAGHLLAASLLALLAVGQVRPGLAEPLIRAMPRDELAELARLLLERPRDLAMLGRAFPQSAWLTEHLPALAAWRITRPAKIAEALRSTPASEAESLLPVRNMGQMPTGLALTSLARRSILPRRTACVLATAKNEGVYLLDWVAYHLSIGFEHVFLYSNDNADGSDALLAALDEAGVISWIRNERGTRLGAQDKAYAHALTMLPQILDYRWAAVIDLDEYIGFDTAMFTDITDFIGLQEVQSVDAVALCWLLFAALPEERWTPDFTPARLTRREPQADKHVKTIFRPRLFCWSRPHDPVPTLGSTFDYRRSDGRPHYHVGVLDRLAAFAEAPDADQAWVSHYLVRTTDELLWKWQRGRANWLDASQRAWFLDFLAKNFFQLARPESLVRDARVPDCAPGRAATRARLLALPGVAAAHAQIVESFAGEIARLRVEVREMAAGESEAVRRLQGLLF